MAYFMAVANRKGGVGKSTMSVMLAYAMALMSRKKVLLIDLDSQSNSSLILLGGERWIEAQRKSRNIAAYIEDRHYSIEQTRIAQYIVDGVGDIDLKSARAPSMSLLPGSLRFEEMQDEMISYYSRSNNSFNHAKNRCAEHFRAALNFASPLADIIILDCAPGLSHATSAALRIADTVVVPFRPDAVSEFAVDRISAIIEGKRNLEEVAAIPFEKRRYICLANYVRPGGRDAIYVDTIAGNHPMLETRMPAMPDIADAFDYLGETQTLEEKYGGAVAPLTALHTELARRLGI